MRKLALLLIPFIMSCQNNNKPENSTPTNETTPQTSLTSYEFYNNFYKDNFYTDSLKGKEITISNLLVYDYTVDQQDATTATLKCMVYNPIKNELIGTNEIYQNGFMPDILLGETAMNVPEQKSYDFQNMVFFIKLKSPQDVKNLGIYNGSNYNVITKTTSPIRDISTHWRQIFKDIITVHGVFTGNNGEMRYSMVLDNSEFTKQQLPALDASLIPVMDSSDWMSLPGTPTRKAVVIVDKAQLYSRFKKQIKDGEFLSKGEEITVEDVDYGKYLKYVHSSPNGWVTEDFVLKSDVQ